MARRHLLLAAALFLPLPASAGVIVLGSGNARMCYLAAESEAPPTSDAMNRCDDALMEERGNARIMAATHVNRGVLRMRRGNIEAAMADFDAATRINPDEPEAYLNRASILLNRDEMSSALSQFDTAITKNTRRPALAYYGRGVANEESGNLRAAYRDYMRASQLAPSWNEPRVELTRFRVASN